MGEMENILSVSKAKGDFAVVFFRASGPGGQKVNKTSSAARVTHMASGAVGECRETRSQTTNKRRAFRRCVECDVFQQWLRIELARRGVETEQEKQHGPTGRRGGEKIRTYNYPRNTVKDHRSGHEVVGVKAVLDGDIDSLIESCMVDE